MRQGRPSARAMLLVALLLATGTALAKEPAPVTGIELERLELNPGAAGSLLVGTGELLPAGALRLSAAGHYQHNPVVMQLGQERLPIIGSRVTTHLAAAWGLTNWLQLEAQVPLVALQRGADLRDRGIAPPEKYGLSTPSVGARWALLSQERADWADIALGVGVGLPVGGASGLSQEVGPRYSPQVMVGRRLGWFRLALEAQALVRPGGGATPESVLKQPQVGNELRFGAVAATVGHQLRWELDVRGAIPLVEKQQGSVELLFGSRYLMNLSTEVFALAGMGVGSAPGTPLFRVMMGTAFGGVIPPRLPGESSVKCSPNLSHEPEECPDMDEDQDGVKNGVDLCPRETGTLERGGCPRRDRDNDGVEDAQDECPDVTGDSRWRGCPMPDDDGDLVENQYDSCPTEKGVAPPEGRGCPVQDKDGDGFEDDVDLCPSLKGPPDDETLQGCPPDDTDRDGVANRFDSCPTAEGTEENRGCPKHEMPLVTLTRAEFLLMSKIFFFPSQPRLDPRSILQLNWVAKVIKEHPEFPLIVVGAHTDNRDRPEVNRWLSQARAEVVRQYLITQGVAPEKLEARGYGGERPIDSNVTAIGRENNRRVEFTIIWPE